MSVERNAKMDLTEKGILFLMGEIDEQKAERICKDIVGLNMQEQPLIQLIINSSGGYCPAGFAIIDIMEWSRVPIYTTGVGRVSSMALLIFISGEKGHRVLTPRTSILSHRYSAMIAGSHSQLVAQRVEEDLMHQRILRHYIQHSAIKSEKELNEKLLRDVDTWLTPEQALQYGLADIIQEDIKQPYPVPGLETPPSLLNEKSPNLPASPASHRRLS